jgi:hypothetical protein
MTAKDRQGEDVERPSATDEVGGMPPLPASADPALETLRSILFSDSQRRIVELEAEVADLERRLADKDAFVAMITPVLGKAIRRSIRDAREEMIQALYPIIGQTVVRAVSEAIRDLARTLDAQMRTSFDLPAVGRRLQARASGVSSAEMTLREALPFNVAEVFLIHRESGLLLWHISRDPATAHDSDLISGMLTAIRDFVEESFGAGGEGQLDEIQYGERRILLETAQYAYLAVVLDGIEPAGFRAEMRERIIEVDHAHETVLHPYQGDPTLLAPVEPSLRSLITASKPPGLTTPQKRILAGVAAMLVICLVGSCLTGSWVWQMVRNTPTPLPVVIAPTPTFTATASPTPTATPSPTATTTPTPTSTPTFTPMPTATWTPTATLTPTPTPVIGLMTGNVWLREGPSADAPRLGLILERGQPIKILAVSGNWYQVHWTRQTGAEVVGWVPVEWVGTTTPVPTWLVTPTLNP